MSNLNQYERYLNIEHDFVVEAHIDDKEKIAYVRSDYGTFYMEIEAFDIEYKKIEDEVRYA